MGGLRTRNEKPESQKVSETAGPGVLTFWRSAFLPTLTCPSPQGGRRVSLATVSWSLIRPYSAAAICGGGARKAASSSASRALAASVVRLLHMAEAADVERQRGDLDGEGVVVGGQVGDQLLDQPLVRRRSGRARAGAPAVRPKRSSGGAAQALQPRQHAEGAAASTGRSSLLAARPVAGRARRAAAARGGSCSL